MIDSQKWVYKFKAEVDHSIMIIKFPKYRSKKAQKIHVIELKMDFFYY